MTLPMKWSEWVNTRNGFTTISIGDRPLGTVSRDAGLIGTGQEYTAHCYLPPSFTLRKLATKEEAKEIVEERVRLWFRSLKLPG